MMLPPDLKIDAVKDVDIDVGVFKYILIKVSGKKNADGSEQSKLIVRGYLRADWHSEIYDEASFLIKNLGFETECLGGGRIDHQPDLKRIKIYGDSTAFGKADHTKTRRILSNFYRDYVIECSDI